MMKKWIYSILALIAFARFECDHHPEVIRCGMPCTHQATVKDLSGLDGCGYVLELKDGSRLVPQRLVYVQEPDPKDDPAYYFNFKDGQKVCFDYREVSGADACMAGKLIFITCLKECSSSSSVN